MPIKDPVVRSIKNKEYREANKERIARQQKEYRERNSEKRNAQKKLYREENKEIINAKGLEYYYNNKEILLTKKAIYRINNKSHINEKDRIYREKNLERCRVVEKLRRHGPRRIEILERRRDLRRDYYYKNLEASRRKSNIITLKQTKYLTHNYIARLLRVPVKILTPDLAQAKRVQMLIHRKLKEIA
jgi:hypothetical protein